MLIQLVRRLHQQGRLAGVLRMLERLRLLAPAFRVYEKLVARDRRSRYAGGARTADNDGPLPAPELVVLVQGSPDTGWFRVSGRAMFQVIADLARKHNAPVGDMQAILEFGCGCGRVLRYWHAVRGPQIHGTDYNPRLLNWCRGNLPFARIARNDLHPPLTYADHVFDYVYAISVFTHLSEDLQDRWMQELTRVLKPGGLLLITTHGGSFRHKLSGAEQAAFDSHRIVVRYADSSGKNLCNAYHPEVYVRDRLAAGYTICEFIPAGTREAIYQDTYLLRKGAPEAVRGT